MTLCVAASPVLRQHPCFIVSKINFPSVAVHCFSVFLFSLLQTLYFRLPYSFVCGLRGTKNYPSRLNCTEEPTKSECRKYRDFFCCKNKPTFCSFCFTNGHRHTYTKMPQLLSLFLFISLFHVLSLCVSLPRPRYVYDTGSHT